MQGGAVPGGETDQEHVFKTAIDELMKGHVGSCLILSSYKLASVLKDRFGTDVNISKVGRFLSKFAKINDLERLETNVPKFKLERDHFESITFDMAQRRKGRGRDR